MQQECEETQHLALEHSLITGDNLVGKDRIFCLIHLNSNLVANSSSLVGIYKD